MNTPKVISVTPRVLTHLLKSTQKNSHNFGSFKNNRYLCIGLGKKELAKEEADLIIREAKENANAIIHEALIDAEKKQQEYELLKKDYNVFKVKVESLVKAQLELLENNKEID